MKTVSVLVFFFLFFLMKKSRSKNLTHCVRMFSCGSLDFRFPFFNTTMPSRREMVQSDERLSSRNHNHHGPKA
ncbi:BnaCnng42850D [Brassica napus]|uniref:BnaCnng42850D protein n=1 Tax=Brassica napus TaxID=3708 RepID=A0A078JCD1_BRANA|nr:BnaCnng42850D [Brassica napus]